jgi:hypothetical protein
MNVVAKKGHVMMLAERGETNVVLEGKMSEHDRQVNARFMSSCVSKSAQFARHGDEVTPCAPA